MRLKDFKREAQRNDTRHIRMRHEPHPFRRFMSRLLGTKKGPDVTDRAVEVLGEDA
jgi:hypothetical protein